MIHQKSAKKWFLRTALAFLGTPYVWGGDDPSGFDCSGYVIECLKSVGLLHEGEDMTAHELYLKFSRALATTPESGALLFYLDSHAKARHVTICLDSQFQIGASGGDSSTTSVTNAWRQNAFVKIRPINFRPTSMRIARIF